MRQKVNELLTPELGESNHAGRKPKNYDGPSELDYDSGQDSTYIKARLRRVTPGRGCLVFVLGVDNVGIK